ncbi:chemotaxis protein CheW [bacterium]|nr:chemotaxis protein CheW [bacterium]
MSRKEQNRNSFESEDYEGLAEDTQKDKYLSFRIGDETYGVSIEYVTEIIVIQKITEVPDTPPFVKGVINLRGKVIPVIDIRHRFGMKSRDYDERTCIIVVDYTETAVGMIVDTVNEVVDIPESQVDQTPRTHSGTESTYIQGMGKIGKKVMIILNLEKVLFAEELLKRQKALQD